METVAAITIVLAGILLLAGLFTSPTEEYSTTVTLHRLHVKNTYYLFSATFFIISCILGVGLAILDRLNGLLTVQFKSQSDIGLRQCPFCAETVKQQALVCRFCGRDLPAFVPPPPPPPNEVELAERRLEDLRLKFNELGTKLMQSKDKEEKEKLRLERKALEEEMEKIRSK
jgi:hypothetical protein